MTQHLRPEEIVDFVEDRQSRLDPDRAAHVTTCDACREQVRELREVMLEASDLTVPEPSPLYWEHSARRVSDAVTADARTRRGRWWQRMSLSHVTTAVTTATVVVAVVFGLPRILLDRPTIEPEVDSVMLQTALDSPEDEIPATAPADWALLLTMADTVEWLEEEADLLMVDREAISSAVFELTVDERRALVRLLEAELENSL